MTGWTEEPTEGLRPPAASESDAWEIMPEAHPFRHDPAKGHVSSLPPVAMALWSLAAPFSPNVKVNQARRKSFAVSVWTP